MWEPKPIQKSIIENQKIKYSCTVYISLYSMVLNLNFSYFHIILNDEAQQHLKQFALLHN